MESWAWQKEHQLLWLEHDLRCMNRYFLAKNRWKANELAYCGCLLVLVYEEIADV